MERVKTMTHGGFHFLKRAALTVLVMGVAAVCILAQGCSNEEDPLVTLQKNMEIYNRNTTASWIPAPATMEELLDTADVIVIGSIASVAGTGIQKSYNEADNERIDEWLEEMKEEYPTPADFYPPYTSYLIDVETVILDDGAISAGYPIVLKMLGKPSAPKDTDQSPSLLTVPNAGETRLFTLLRNPDGTYGLYGWWSHFVIDGDRVTYSDDLRTPIGFTDQVKPDDFINALEDAAVKKNES